MTLKQLEAFYWAATCASFSMAAQRVHLTVSSLSKRVTELEASVGQALFDRSGQRAVLTPAGERLLPQAVDLLRRAEQTRATVGSTGGLQGNCRIGTGELASMTWLAKWVSTVRDEHPALNVNVVVDVGDALAGRLERGELDVAVIAGRSSRPNLRSTPLASASFVWCTQAASPEGQLLNASTWARRTLITLPRGSGVTHILDDWMERAGAQPQETLTCNHWGAVAGLITAGLGIGLLPTALAKGLQGRSLVQILTSRHKLRLLEYGFHFRHEDPRVLIPTLGHLCTAAADFDTPGPFF